VIVIVWWKRVGGEGGRWWLGWRLAEAGWWLAEAGGWRWKVEGDVMRTEITFIGK
jgi:hypothetical protein